MLAPEHQTLCCPQSFTQVWILWHELWLNFCSVQIYMCLLLGGERLGSLVGLFFRREHKTFSKTCESWISLRSLRVYQVWLRLATWLRSCWRTRGGGHSADCIRFIFSLASYGKKSWLAMTSFLTAHRTLLFRSIFSQISPICLPIQYLKLHIWHKPVLTDDHENAPFYFRGKKMETLNTGLLPVCLQPAERFPH